METRFRYTSTNPYIKSKTDWNFLTDRGVYPYDYMNSWEKFDETKLPKKENVCSKLYEENITDKDYTRANIVRKHFNSSGCIFIVVCRFVLYIYILFFAWIVLFFCCYRNSWKDI